jgi:hypothetical protein
MQFYYYIILFVGLSTILFLIRYFSSRKKNIPVQLYFHALKDENNGNFEEAIITYENALVEVRKMKYNNTLKNKIVEKLKLLHTVINYNNNSLSPVKAKELTQLKNYK